MILGLTKVSAGSIEIREGSKIGYSPETPYFPPFLTAMEVMSYYAGLGGDKAQKDKTYLKGLLELAGLEDDKTKVKNFSKGMIQRLALAQALIEDPDVMILDEPTASMDAIGAAELMQIFKEAAKEKCLILIGHTAAVLTVCDRVIILKEGRVQAEGAPDAIDHPFLTAFRSRKKVAE